MKTKQKNDELHLDVENAPTEIKQSFWSKNKIYIILIIISCFFITSILLTRCTAKPVADTPTTAEVQNLRSLPKRVQASPDLVYYSRKDNISVPSAVSSGYSERVCSFSDGSYIQLEYQDTYLYLKLYAINQSATYNPYTMARYYYSNYHLYDSSVSPNQYYVATNALTLYENNNIPFGVASFSTSQFIATGVSSVPSGFNMIYLIDANIGSVDYQAGYSDGYAVGIVSGENNVINNPQNYDLYTEAQYDAYGDERYNEGIDVNLAEHDLTFGNLILTILRAPGELLKGMFNFEIFGINVSNLVLFVFSLGAVILVIQIFKGKSQ